VPLAYLLDALTLTQLYVVGFAVGVFTVFFDVSYQSYLPSLVRREQLTEANGKLEVSRSAAQTAGPGVAGGLVSLLTAPYAILADSLSFVASALFVTRIQREELLPDADAERGRLRTEIADGLRFVLRHPILRWNLVYVGLANFFGNVMFSIFLVYAVRDLGLTAATIGLIGSLGNVGLLGGALVAPRLSSRFGAGPVLIATAAASGWSLLLIPLASGDLAIPLLVASGLGFGFCVVVYNVTGISLMQAITPDRMLGRMNASRRFIVWGVIPLGMLLGGVLGSNLGLRETLWIGAIGNSLAFVPLLVSPIWSIKTIADAEDALSETVTDA